MINDADQVPKSIDVKLELGTAVYGPVTLCHFYPNITQKKNLSCCVDGGDKRDALERLILMCLRRKLVNNNLNKIEMSLFASFNNSHIRLESTVSPFCAPTASSLHYFFLCCISPTWTKQQPIICELKRHKKVFSFWRLCNNQNYSIIILVVEDARNPFDSAQPSKIYGFLIGSLDHKIYCYRIAWTLHNSKHSIRFTAAEKILADEESIDKSLMLKRKKINFALNQFGTSCGAWYKGPSHIDCNSRVIVQFGQTFTFDGTGLESVMMMGYAELHVT